MSDTPRSDEVFFAQHEEAGYALEAMYDRSCELERELAVTKQELEAKKEIISNFIYHLTNSCGVDIEAPKPK